MSNDQVMIRPFRPDDRAVIRRISYETSFLESPQLFVNDQDVVADALTRYFTDFEPDASFVAEENGSVIGYLTGAVDARAMDETIRRKILPGVAGRLLARRLILEKNVAGLVWHSFVSFWEGEFHMPDFSPEFPSTFHINLDRAARGHAVGRKLVRHFEDFLKAKGIPGVHVRTMSEEAMEFFRRVGYEIIFQSRRSFLKYRLGRVFNYYVLGKRL